MYTQSYEIDYQEMFALVARLNAVRVLQEDVKNAFFNRVLEEEVYMDIISEFVTEAAKKK